MREKISTYFEKSLKLFFNETAFGIFNFLTSIILARKLGPEFFGVWGLILLLLAYGEAFGRVKVDNASIFVVGNSSYKPGQIILSANIITILSSALVLGLFLFFSENIYNLISPNNEETFIVYTPWIVVIFFLQNLFLNYCYIFLAIQNTKIYGLAISLRSLLFLIFTALLVYADHLSITNVLKCLSASYLIFLIILATRFHISNGFYFSLSSTLNRVLIKKGLQFYYIGITSQLNLSASLIIAAQVLSASNLGIFYAAKNLSELLFTRVGAAFNAVMFTTISNFDGSKEDKLKLTFSVFLKVLSGFIVLYFITYFLWHHIIPLIYGSAYQDATKIVQILTLGYLFYSGAQIFVQYFYGIGKESIFKYIFFLGFLVQIVLFYSFQYDLNSIAISLISVMSFSLLALVIFLLFMMERK